MEQAIKNKLSQTIKQIWKILKEDLSGQLESIYGLNLKGNFQHESVLRLSEEKKYIYSQLKEYIKETSKGFH